MHRARWLSSYAILWQESLHGMADSPWWLPFGTLAFNLDWTNPLIGSQRDSIRTQLDLGDRALCLQPFWRQSTVRSPLGNNFSMAILLFANLLPGRIFLSEIVASRIDSSTSCCVRSQYIAIHPLPFRLAKLFIRVYSEKLFDLEIDQMWRLASTTEGHSHGALNSPHKKGPLSKILEDLISWTCLSVLMSWSVDLWGQGIWESAQ